jgi:hypothetical protein
VPGDVAGASGKMAAAVAHVEMGQLSTVSEKNEDPVQESVHSGDDHSPVGTPDRSARGREKYMLAGSTKRPKHKPVGNHVKTNSRSLSNLTVERRGTFDRHASDRLESMGLRFKKRTFNPPSRGSLKTLVHQGSQMWERQMRSATTREADAPAPTHKCLIMPHTWSRVAWDTVIVILMVSFNAI